MKFEWSDEYNVNFDEIDAQHKKFFSFINVLYDAIKENRQKEVLSKIIPELIQYTHYHFSTEEKYMKQYNYKGYSEHKAAHEKFVKEFSELVEQAMNKEKAVPLKVLIFLNQWLLTHIAEMDKKVGQFLHELGVKPA